MSCESDGGSEGEDSVQSCLEENYATLGLLEPSVAQETSAVHAPGLLSMTEVSWIREAVRQAQEDNAPFGTIERGEFGHPEDGGVWRTSFLQTGGYFRKMMPLLRGKIRTAFDKIDSEHWGVLTGRPPESLNFRVPLTLTLTLTLTLALTLRSWSFTNTVQEAA